METKVIWLNVSRMTRPSKFAHKTGTHHHHKVKTRIDYYWVTFTVDKLVFDRHLFLAPLCLIV